MPIYDLVSNQGNEASRQGTSAGEAAMLGNGSNAGLKALLHPARATLADGRRGGCVPMSMFRVTYFPGLASSGPVLKQFSLSLLRA